MKKQTGKPQHMAKVQNESARVKQSRRLHEIASVNSKKSFKIMARSCHKRKISVNLAVFSKYAQQNNCNESQGKMFRKE